MPSYTRQPRDTSYCVDATPHILYCFKTVDLSALPGITSADLTALGIRSIPATSVKVRVFGASAPKPPRYRKKTNGGINARDSVTTFASYNRAAQAAEADWTLAKAGTSVNLRGANPSQRTQTAIATLSNGAMFAFPMNQVDFNNFGTVLGLQSAEQISNTERDYLVRGKMGGLRPGTASFRNDDGSLFRSFYATEQRDELEAAGFSCTAERVQFPVTSAPAP